MIRILIVDDHPIVRRGLRSVIKAHRSGMEVVGEAENGLEAVRMAEELTPDVILMDLVMPGKDGIEAIRDIRRANPNAHILVLTSFNEEDRAFAAIKAGALGYLIKNSSAEELIQAIRDVASGNSWLHPNIARKLIVELNEERDEAEHADALTDREMQVLKLAARGLTNRDIAAQLVISEATVRFHVGNILSKLHLANRTQAVLYALREGLAELKGQNEDLLV
jgi:NarL family two-component system response regulator LiaR